MPVSDPGSAVEGLRAGLLATYREFVPRGSRVALIDFPNHPNVGDTAIWLGELAALRELECEVAYVASFSSWSADALRHRLGRDGVVLIHGGGNLGDVWPTFQAFRERVIAAHREHPVVQLPQTVHFSRPEAAAAAGVASRHPQLVMLARDRRSEAILREHFPYAEVRLCTDSAFALGSLVAPPPEFDVLCLLRTDSEGTLDRGATGGARVVDWDTQNRALHQRWRLSRLLGYPLKRTGTSLLRVLDDPIRRTFDLLARERMRAGLDVVAQGEVLVTDRLHGHIMALLLGRPSVLLDNSYGKNRAFYELWTADSPLTSFAGSLAEGIERARSVVEDARAPAAAGDRGSPGRTT